MRKPLLEKSRGVQVGEPLLKLSPPESRVSAFINKHHTLSRSHEQDSLGSQKTEGLTLPGNIYTKEMTFALVLRGQQMARMTRAKGLPYTRGTMCQGLETHKQSYDKKFTGPVHQGPVHVWPGRSPKRDRDHLIQCHD